MGDGKPRDIRERTLEYALRAIRLYRHLDESRDAVARIIGKQYLRSATSIGANLEEAQGGESRADFVHKNSIAFKEAREARYWLRLLHESETVESERLIDIMEETEQLVAILTTIVRNAKQNASKR